MEDLLRQLLDGGFQFPQQSVVRFNLPIQFTAVGDNALFLHSPCHHTFVDGGLLDQTSLGMTAVVDTGIVSVSFQIAVGYVCPCLAPYDKLFLAVPTFGDGILSAELGAFGVLAGSLQALLLCFGGRHILWQKHLTPDQSFLTGIIVPHSIVVIEDVGTAQICRSCNGRPPRSPADHLGF